MNCHSWRYTHHTTNTTANCALAETFWSFSAITRARLCLQRSVSQLKSYQFGVINLVFPLYNKIIRIFLPASCGLLLALKVLSLDSTRVFPLLNDADGCKPSHTASLMQMMQMVASPLTSPERTASSTIEPYGSLSPKSGEHFEGAKSFTPRFDLQGVSSMTRYQMTCRWQHLHRLQQRLCRKHLNCAFGAWMHIVSLFHFFCRFPLVCFCVRKSLIWVCPWTKVCHLVSVCGPDLSVSMNPLLQSHSQQVRRVAVADRLLQRRIRRICMSVLTVHHKIMILICTCNSHV